MATLLSPGVSVTITDESFYATAGNGTIPLVIIATAANKLQPGSTTSIAPGTLASAANQLYLTTSQRDVLQYFGNPNFYSVAGSPQYDNELNEFGLFALYEYLGIANSAYVLRADIDLGQLQPSTTPPVGSATNGAYWLDLTNTTYGIFKSNGNVNSAYSWQAKTPTVISTASNLEVVVQGLIVPAISSGSLPVIQANGNITINGVVVPVLAGDSITTVASKINNSTGVSKLGITATIFVQTGKYDPTQTSFGDIFNLRLVASNIETTIDLVGSTTGVLNNLGLVADPTNVIAPKSSFGNEGDYAVDAFSTDGDTAPNNKIWEKITLTTATSTTGWWFKVGGIATTYPGWDWTSAVANVVTGTVSNPTFTPGEQFSIKIGSAVAVTLTVPAAIGSASTATLSQIVDTINTGLNTGSLNAIAYVYSVGNSRYLRIANYDGTSIQFNDLSAMDGNEHPWRDAGILPTQTYYNSVTGTVLNPTFVAATMLTSSATTVAPGAGYIVGDTLTVAGGTTTQASQLAVASIQVTESSVLNGGSGYAVNDTVTFGGSDYTTPVILTVTTVSAGQITGLSVTQAGQYTGTVPTNPVTPTSTSGAGTSATINLTWGVSTVTVAVPGNYTVVPTNPASVTGGSGTGATFTLVTGFNTSNTFTIDPGTGPVTVNVPASPNNTLSGVISAINAAFPTGPIVASSNGGYLQLLNQNGTSFIVEDVSGTPLNGAGIPVGFAFGRQLVYQGYSPSLTVPNNVAQLAVNNVWINTTPSDRGANYVVKRYVDGAWVAQNTLPNTGTIPMYVNDASADAGFGANKNIGSIYVRYNSEGNTPPEANHKLYVWDGSVWSELSYTPSLLAPSGPPANGTLWYDTTLQYDIMVTDGQIWRGYRNVYPATDPNGPILDGSAPITQSDNTPLVDNDIWIDTSVTSAFTAYRYDVTAQNWVLIDNTDHSSPAGIIFSDARPNTTGLADGSTLISDMVLSDYVDPDAPNALLYPARLLMLNTRYSTNNIKQYVVNKFPTLPAGSRDRWVTSSGNAPDGTPYIGYNAQRAVIVEALNATIVSNQEARAENTFFNLLACPGYTETISNLVALNTDKKSTAFIIGDTPKRLAPDGTSIQNWATNANDASGDGDVGLTTSDPYTGIYYPWGLGTNLDGTNVFVPPSVMALRTYAYNDQVAYPWFAPAGFNRGLVTGMNSVGYLLADGTYQPLILNQGQRDVMYTNKINPIAYIPGRGLVIYGQKTLSPVASALDRVNVARLVNYLNYQLSNLAQPYLFEPNDIKTQQAVETTFNSFLGSLVSLRALYDYTVICDASNNPPAVVDANELYIDIAIKPEKAIEFIYIPVRLLNTGDPLPNGSQNPTA